MDKALTYKEKLANSIREAFKNHPQLDAFLDYKLIYKKQEKRSFGAAYYPGTKTIITNLDFKNRNDLLLSVLIHEVSHHVEYMQEGYSNHDKTFRYIQERILDAAFDLNYLKPYKLIIYYKYLSHYTEEKKVVKMCKNYLKNTQKHFEPVYFIFVKFKYDENVKNYLKENGFTYFDDQLTRGWYRFFDKEEQYNEFQSEILRIKDLMPKISLDFIYSGEVITT